VQLKARHRVGMGRVLAGFQYPKVQLKVYVVCEM